MSTRNLQCAAVWLGVALAPTTVLAVPVIELVEIESFLAPGDVVQMQYSPSAGLLFMRNSGSTIRVLNTATRLQTSWQVPNYTFTDMDLTPDGRYLYAADDGGEASYVHRYDLSTGVWEAKAVPGVGGRVEAVDSQRFCLLEIKSWGGVTLDRWGTSITELSRTSSSLDSGDIQYDPATGRIIHGARSSTYGLSAFQVVGDTLVVRESTGTYGSASGGGGSNVLSTDGRNYYYGKLQVDPLDVRINRVLFPGAIYAASADIAFGQNTYYDALTGAVLGNLGFSTSIYSLNSSGTELWAFDPASDYLHHYTIVPEPLTGLILSLSSSALLARQRRRHSRPDRRAG